MRPVPLCRRAFLRMLAAGAAAPAGAGLASGRPKVLGYLSGGQGPEWLSKLLAERGYVEGRNLRIETRIPADWEAATLRKAAEELVALRPDALYAILAIRVEALAAATRTIPIVAGVPDPVGAGFAKSLRRPGANVTGLSFGLPETADIVVGIFKALRPGLKRVGGIFAKGTPPAHRGTWWIASSRKSGVEFVAMVPGSESELREGLATLAGQAAFVAPTRDPDFGRRTIELATGLGIMTAGPLEHGAFMSYALEHEDGERRIAAILDRVLRGESPADIPFELPSRQDFVLNRRVARRIGVEIPPDILLRVDRFVD
jgi:putative ABC transport system substrate-binding protein